MRLVITIKNFPHESSNAWVNRIRLAIERIWCLDVGRNASYIEVKLEEDAIVHGDYHDRERG